jgi:CubicO group peptidase (beta-lactamase class C family)
MWMKSIFFLIVAMSASLANAQSSMLTTREMSRMSTPERIEAGLKTHAAHIYRLAAAKTPRELPKEEAPEALASVQSFARDTQATLLIEKGRIVFEYYGAGVKPNSLLHGFSIGKSWTALAVGEALCAGKIKSLDDTAQSYVPQLEGTSYGRASLRNLLRYTSGAEDPGGTGYTGIHSISDFGSMMEQSLSLVDLIKKHADTSRYQPGEQFSYNGLNSEALSLVIRAVTGMSLPAWFEASVWQEAGAEFAGAWFFDKEGNGVAEVLSFASARDHARIGLYILDRLNGQAGSACMQNFVQQAVQDTVKKGYWWTFPKFGLGIHIGEDGMPWLTGAAGQRVGVNPNKQRVFTTLSDGDLRTTDSGSRAILNR